MSKPDKDKIIPWLGVVFAGLVLGALGRYIALQHNSDTGTSNLTFVIVLGGIVFMYLLLLIFWDSIHQIINKKRGVVDSKLPAAPPKDCDEPEQNVDHIGVYPYSDGGEDTSSGSDEGNSGEEETESQISIATASPTITATPSPPRIDWREQHEREFRGKLVPFREYTHFAMGPYVSEAELARLDEYVELFAREAPLPKETAPIRPERLKNPDLYHFGWNMQNYFKVGKREDVVPWLQRVFPALKDLEYSTIKGKLHDPQTKRHTIPNIDDIPKFMTGKRS